jgi:hypothetical protein
MEKCSYDTIGVQSRHLLRRVRKTTTNPSVPAAYLQHINVESYRYTNLLGRLDCLQATFHSKKLYIH